MGHDDPSLGGLAAAGHDRRPARLVHVEAVAHHGRLNRKIEPGAAEPQHLLDVRVLEEQLARQLVVLLVERPAGDQYPYFHQRNSACSAAVFSSAYSACSPPVFSSPYSPSSPP